MNVRLSWQIHLSVLQLSMTLLVFMLCLRRLNHSIHAEHFTSTPEMCSLCCVQITLTVAQISTEILFCYTFRDTVCGTFVKTVPVSMTSRLHRDPPPCPVLCAYFWTSSGELEECLLWNCDCE